MDRRELIKLWMAWKAERENGVYTFKLLAEQAGLNANYLSNVMTGIRNPGIQTLTKIAEALGVSLAEFYAGPPVGKSAVPHDAVASHPLRESSLVPSNVPMTENETGVHHSSFHSLPHSGNDSKTEKFGLKFSLEGHDGFDRLFSSFGFNEADFVTKEGGQAEFVAKEEINNGIFDGLVNEKTLDVSLETPSFPAGIPTERIDSTVKTIADDPVLVAITSQEDSYTASLSSEGANDENDIPLLPQNFKGDIGMWLARASSSEETTFIRRRFSVDGKRIFAVSVTDDSMAPDIMPGDVLYVDPDSSFSGGDGKVAFLVTDTGVLIRRVFGLGAGVFHLIPTNTRYVPSIVAKPDAIVMKIVFWLPLRDGMF